MTFDEISIGTIFKIIARPTCAPLEKVSETECINLTSNSQERITFYGTEIAIYIKDGKNYVKAPEADEEDL